ncbi:2-hydroxyacid dehydrogenase [Glycomyces arizonensis]|uniref:2-hydroxyacid dehydrogenase n=1 Tax=Glycomyces arizonensis TaxID=256035 RepID=UPI0003F8620E|nr:2-hydroxyacid dehydrogenase [Glycomyces arizonensis]
MKVWISHADALPFLGALPDGVDVEVWDGGEYPSDPADVEFWVPPSLRQDPVEVVRAMPALRVVQLLSAGAEVWVPHVPDGVALCDNRGAHTEVTAEWVAAATLASVRELDFFARKQAEHEWSPRLTGTLSGRTALIVGAGSIGESVARRFEACNVTVAKIARTARPGVGTLADLPELLPAADVVVIIVPLTPETEGMVDAGFLTRMKDGALLVNAARGKVVDTGALTAEVASGRLRCALDVTEPEPLPAEHPLWGLEGALITPHAGGAVEGLLERCYPPVGDQIRRLAAGEPLANVVEHGY